MLEEFIADEALRQGIEQSILLGALVVARLIPIVQMVPYLGGEAVPQTVKMGLAIALAIVVYPSIWMQGGAMLVPSGTFEIVVLIVKEVFVGVTIGFVCALSFEALRMAGQIIDNTAGLTDATTMVPQLPDRISPTSNFLYQLAIVFFFAIGGHRVFLWALARSFELIPPYGYIDVGDGLAEVAMLILRLTAEAITLGVLMAFPVLASIMLTNLFLALVNKSAPQINVFFLGMPLKAVLASAIVLLSVGVLMEQFVDRSLEDMALLVEVMEGLGVEDE